MVKDNAYHLRIVGKLFTYAVPTGQFKAEPRTVEDLRKYRNLIVENPFYLTKDQQSYLAEVMGLDYAFQIDIVTHDVAIELLTYICKVMKHESWSTRIRVFAHAILDSPEFQTWIVEGVPTECADEHRLAAEPHGA